MRHPTTIFVLFAAIAIYTSPTNHAASPPSVVNYQGVLRDASDRPLDGDHDMVFRFFNAETGGDEIMIDSHIAAVSEPVAVTGGLFSARFGAGRIQDGSGPGNYTSLADVFRDYGDVWLSVEVAGELLDPRVQVAAAPYAHNAKHLDGRSAAGFIDTTSTAQTKAGTLTIESSSPGEYGLVVTGMEGAYFEDGDHSGQAWIANGNWGVGGKGNVAGGSFEDRDDSGYAHVGSGDYGIEAYGNHAGGYFVDTDNDSYARVGNGGYGIRAYGNLAGGHFEDTDTDSHARIAEGGFGIQAYGYLTGGHFEDTDNGSYADVGLGTTGIDARGVYTGGHFKSLSESGFAHVGVGDDGIRAFGNTRGGNFGDLDSSGYAYVADGDYGIYASGDFVGGRFENSLGGSYADVGREDYGIRAHGNNAGGTFDDLDSSAYAYVANGSYKINGTGSVNFVQNHPERSDQVIVYAAPEGDEVATYTRGTARLRGGEARVTLGETFKWVTNPDIGLTVHLTPVGEWSELYVEEKSTREIVVRSRSGDGDEVFDYIVFGLRIGFEEASVVQAKTVESFIPSMKDHRDLYEHDPDLRRFNALERFTEMVADVEGVDAVNLSRAAELKGKIQEYDPETHGPTDRLQGHEPRPRERETGDEGPPAVEEAHAARARERQDLDEVAVEKDAVAAMAATVTPTADKLRGQPLPANEIVEAGDVIALDPEHPGKVRAASAMADPRVVGVAVGTLPDAERTTTEDTLEAWVVANGFVECKADAGYGSIQAGDLLTTSPTPGHAMRAIDALPGTILGKALEPLETGTGTIKILVMPR